MNFRHIGYAKEMLMYFYPLKKKGSLRMIKKIITKPFLKNFIIKIQMSLKSNHSMTDNKGSKNI